LFQFNLARVFKEAAMVKKKEYLLMPVPNRSDIAIALLRAVILMLDR